MSKTNTVSRFPWKDSTDWLCSFLRNPSAKSSSLNKYNLSFSRSYKLCGVSWERAVRVGFKLNLLVSQNVSYSSEFSTAALPFIFFHTEYSGLYSKVQDLIKLVTCAAWSRAFTSKTDLLYRRCAKLKYIYLLAHFGATAYFVSRYQ